MSHDRPQLPGVRRFALDAGADCQVQCELTAGALTGLATNWGRLEAADGIARVACAVPVLEAGESMVLKLYDFVSAGGSFAAARMNVQIGGQAPLEVRAANLAGGPRELEIPGASDAMLELRGVDPGASVAFTFERRIRTAEP
jgi:hypothetical protein